MSNQTDTPRTDAFEYYFSNHDSCAGESMFTVQADSDVTFNKEFEGYSVPSNLARQLERELNEARAEIAKLRQLFPKVLEACDNGSVCTADASLEFLACVSDEVRGVVAGWKNKWTAAVEMAARAEVRRDREANLLDMILIMAATGTDECLRLVIRQAATALAEMDEKEPV